jgi:hypothetical protein
MYMMRCIIGPLIFAAADVSARRAYITQRQS